MAAPNIVSVTSIVGKTTDIKPANTRMGIDTTVTLYFRCLDERDSEYVRPHLQKAPDLLIESK